MAERILVLHGPNLNLLGERQPAIYGAHSLNDVDSAIKTCASELGVEVTCRQSNHEGELIDWLHAGDFAGVVLNGAAYSHTSVALRDAVAAIAQPVVEVHISNVHKREPFRHVSLLSAVCIGCVAGFGRTSYTLGLRAVVDALRAQSA